MRDIKIYEISKDDYFKIIVTGPNSQTNLFEKVNEKKDLSKMIGLNLVEKIMQDICGIIELDTNSEIGKVRIVVTDYSKTKEACFSNHIEVLCGLFKITKSDLSIIEKYLLSQKGEIISKGNLIYKL